MAPWGWGWREGAPAIRFHPELPELAPVRSAEETPGLGSSSHVGTGTGASPGPSARAGLHKPALRLQPGLSAAF